MRFELKTTDAKFMRIYQPKAQFSTIRSHQTGDGILDDASKSMNHLTVIVYLDAKQKPEKCSIPFSLQRSNHKKFMFIY